MACPKEFEYLPHTADIIVVGYGETLEEAFANAAKGVFNIITDVKKVEPKECREVIDEADDLEQALYKWIDDLLLYFDAEGMVFSKFELELKEEEGKVKIHGKACGEKFDPSKHEYGTIVKAMTYAEMEIKKEGECWKVKFVVDI
ncbi:archease [Ignicoccus hospitalis]|uniref:Protein archease n=1 Tax=Ignicoccus hospitalis (strain KIN4/I / DSM 18386 / JCM 14125) TaxID=453591 RepID=A8A8E4_IGNH4|nr:archease [Ignicoccus hospitalis]ABU81196.1 protein of unknown function DUF101 [Ignicoccus hospitalis KIN4/I]HIH90626.1 archease [Desulfurococcaceae archaeon]